MKRYFSGIRPTGHIHLGNYLGAIKQWLDVTDKDADQLYCVVDQHALTTESDATNLSHNTKVIAATYLACGLDPKDRTIFVQSHVRGHTELSWYLSCLTPLGWLNRMTQFKDKAGKHKDKAKLGLYAYPVLQAADVLLYKTTHVPIGEDQKQHIELSRDIATLFNNYVNKDIMIQPEPLIQKSTARIMSLRNGLNKMSKSDESDYTRINLLDDDDLLALKIKKAKTDPDLLNDQLDNRPEAKNLLSILAALKGESFENIVNQYNGKAFSDLKTELTDVVIGFISPLRTKIQDYMNNQDYLNDILKQGAERANAIAEANLKDFKQALNILS